MGKGSKKRREKKKKVAKWPPSFLSKKSLFLRAPQFKKKTFFYSLNFPAPQNRRSLSKKGNKWLAFFLFPEISSLREEKRGLASSFFGGRAGQELRTELWKTKRKEPPPRESVLHFLPRPTNASTTPRPVLSSSHSRRAPRRSERD